MNHDFRKVLSATLSAALIAGCIAGCSSDLGPESLPSTTESTVATSDTTEASTSAAETTEATTTSASETETQVELGNPVNANGQLRIEGANIVNKNGTPYQLRGVSSYNFHECSDVFTDDVIKTLGSDWGCNVVRLAFYGDVNEDPGYGKMEKQYFEEMCNVTDSLIEQGLYVIIDWQINENGDPMQNKDVAVDFFSKVSAAYGDKENIIYEICSNPNGEIYNDPDSGPVDWPRIKEYAEAVTAAIRENDPDNIIICGTRDNCLEIMDPAEDSLADENTCYAYHFSGSLNGFQDDIVNAGKKGICVFASEWYPVSNWDEEVTMLDNTKDWLDFLDSNKISWVSWPMGSNGQVSFDLLKTLDDEFTEEVRAKGHWDDVNLSRLGKFVKDRLGSYS